MLRPSGAPRWVPCPPSARLGAPFPDIEGEDAKEGTAAHWAGGQVLGGHVSALEELTDRTAPNGVIIDGEMVEATRLYIDTVPPGCVIERELPSAIQGVDSGTPDARRVDGRHGHVWDFKYGWGIVEAVGNWQGACYVVSLFAKHGWELDAVTFHIIQPRPWHPDGKVRSWKITRDDAIALHGQLTDAAVRAYATNTPCVTGPHCHDCRAAHVCEAARRAALNAVDVTYAATPIELPPVAIAAELRMLRRAADAIKLRCDAMESNALAMIDRGGIIPGWSTERAFGRTRWLDGKVPALEAISGVTLTEPKPVTPAEAKRRGVPTALLKQFTTTPETGRKLIERDSSAKAKEVFK